MEDATKSTSSFMLFILLAYGAIWGLFGLGRWFEIPFSMDPRAPGGLFYLVGAALPSSCAIVAVLVIERRDGLRRLMQRSLTWRFSPFWYLAAILIPFAVTGINAAMAMLAAMAYVIIKENIQGLITEYAIEIDEQPQIQTGAA